MTPRRQLAGAAAVLLGLTALAVLVGPATRETAGPSSLSRGPAGWLAARLWLERRGTEVELWDRPLGEAPPRGTLVVTFPWLGGPAAGDSTADPAADPGEALRRRVEAGGDLLVAFSGERDAVEEGGILLALGLIPGRLRGPAPLDPRGWLRHAREEWELPPEPPVAALRPPRVGAFDAAPRPPREGRVLYRTPAGAAAVFTFRGGGGTAGRVAVLPAAVLTNGRLGEPGNGDLLETLRGWLGEPWIFDEYHHGLAAPAAVEEQAARGWVMDLAAAHLVALYLLAAVALGRRFGTPWREPPVVAGSTGGFFLGLGELHHRLGHHGEGARLLLERLEELDGEPPLPPGEARRAEAADAAAFLDLARRAARRR